jgi:SAM-dependent methyltransferase
MMYKSYPKTKSAAHDTRVNRWPDFSLGWHLLGSPLRPVDQDAGFCEDAVMEWNLLNGAPRVLILGVTPELYRLSWPERTDIIAADSKPSMIDNVWPGPQNAALLTDWLDLDLPEGSRDIVLCDGGLHLMSYPDEQRQFFRVLSRIISDDGLLIIRLFTPPPKQESPDAILEDLLAGKISNLNIMKLRLGMSIMENYEEGVELRNIWNMVNRVAPDLNKLAANIGWPLEQTLVLNAYEESTIRYYYVTVDQVLEMACCNPGDFEIKSVRIPSYELGQQCPTLVLKRISRSHPPEIII